mmetsp:Transcript_24219/g.43057  ORF Transcript_24219/g.43057 Transcript_24219/m.43057 type:complete len:256 (+) Transcript_24219:133-900(+)
MSGELSSISRIGSSSSLGLREIKCARQKLDRDAQTLSNRIRLLTFEEMRTLKRIEETVRKTQEIEDAQRRAQERLEARESYHNLKSKRLTLARDHINKLRTDRSKELKYQRNLILNSKHQDYEEGRRLREHSLKARKEHQLTKTQENRRKSDLVKWDQQKAAETLQSFQDRRLKQAKDNYLHKVDEESHKKEHTERRIVEMEKVELELISRLQNTQHLHQEAFQKLEQAITKLRRSQSQPDFKVETRSRKFESNY